MLRHRRTISHQQEQERRTAEYKAGWQRLFWLASPDPDLGQTRTWQARLDSELYQSKLEDFRVCRDCSMRVVHSGCTFFARYPWNTVFIYGLHLNGEWLWGPAEANWSAVADAATTLVRRIPVYHFCQISQFCWGMISFCDKKRWGKGTTWSWRRTMWAWCFLILTYSNYQFMCLDFRRNGGRKERRLNLIRKQPLPGHQIETLLEFHIVNLDFNIL